MNERILPVVATLLVASYLSPLHAQESPAPIGWEPTGLPALNYDSDEGFGYGVLFELYNYGDGGYAPYRFTIQPTVFLTTGGRREFERFRPIVAQFVSQWPRQEQRPGRRNRLPGLH
jgi:hypothetical protein